MEQLVVGLALQKTKPSIAAIYRQVVDLAPEHDWKAPGYDCVYDIVNAIDPALFKLAHEGDKAYGQSYDLLYRREATQSNEIWQGRSQPLGCLVVGWTRGKPARPLVDGH